MDGGLEIKSIKPELYKIAGDNRQFIEAHVEIEADGLVFSSDLIQDPIAVRYAFSNTAEGNLYNKAGLPASPFRTDDWPILYNSVAIKSIYDPLQQGFMVSMEGSGDDQIVYTLDGVEPGLESKLYSGPFLVKQKTNIHAKAVSQNQLSEQTATKEVLIHKATYRPIQYLSSVSTKYGGQGLYTLLNGQRGNVNNSNDPEWQGWDGTDMEVILDLGENQKTRKITVGFLQNQNSWIFLPTQVMISMSSNGRNYNEIYNQTMTLTNDPVNKSVQYAANVNNATRYIKIKAINVGTCPPWHPGSGSKAWLFADEVLVE
jgi:Fn3 associated/F5/8 type C domain